MLKMNALGREDCVYALKVPFNRFKGCSEQKRMRHESEFQQAIKVLLFYSALTLLLAFNSILLILGNNLNIKEET